LSVVGLPTIKPDNGQQTTDNGQQSKPKPRRSTVSGQSSNVRGGDPTLAPRRVADSQVRLSLPMNPDMANALGNVHGGEIVSEGTPDQIMAAPASLTGQYLVGLQQIAVPKRRRQGLDKRIS